MPTASAAASVEWLLGKDQSPCGGHGTIGAGAPATARHGRSSVTRLLTTSLRT